MKDSKADSNPEYVDHLCALVEASSSSLQSAWFSTEVSVDSTPKIMSHLETVRNVDRLTYACQHDRLCRDVRHPVRKAQIPGTYITVQGLCWPLSWQKMHW